MKEDFKELRPDYYGGPDAPYEPWKVIKAHQLSYHSGSAVAYILRAGKKPGSDRAQELTKAATHLMQEVRDLMSSSHKEPTHEAGKA